MSLLIVCLIRLAPPTFQAMQPEGTHAPSHGGDGDDDVDKDSRADDAEERRERRREKKERHERRKKRDSNAEL